MRSSLKNDWGGIRMLKDFKEFAMKGNVIDLAVAVIIGGAFGKIITSLVEDMLMPLIGIFMGGVSLADLSLSVGDAVFAYGMFIQNIIDFIIIALLIFLMIRFMKKLEKKKEIKASEPKLTREEELLVEIRDLLKNK